jgi:hypothetical protein
MPIQKIVRARIAIHRRLFGKQINQFRNVGDLRLSGK